MTDHNDDRETDPEAEVRDDPAAETAEPEAEPTDLEVLRAIAASEAGLTLQWGRWVEGETPDEVRADAAKLAEAVGKYQGRQAGGLDGGARGTVPEPPSFDSKIRAEIEQRREEVNRRAEEIEATKRHGGNGHA